MRFQISNFRFQIALIALISLFASTAAAQHADIRPYVDGGQIKTKGYVDATSEEIPGLRVFGYDFGEFDPPDQFLATDPGFSAAPGSGLPAGSQLSFNIPDAANFDLPGNLSYWDGVGELSLTSWIAPAGVRLRLNVLGSNVSVGDVAGFQTGLDLQTVAAAGVVHRHLNAYLNDGVANPPAGIYLLPLELASSDAGIQTSLPFFVVYNNGLSEEAHDEAIDWVQDNLLTIPGDFDGDGDVDGADFVAWQTHFPMASGATLDEGDADRDGDVDGADFVVWQTHFPTTVGGATVMVPEPASLLFTTLLGLAGVRVGRTRRGRRKAWQP
jgi:hypothetical protein